MALAPCGTQSVSPKSPARTAHAFIVPSTPRHLPLPVGRGMTYFYLRSLRLRMRRENYYRKPWEPSGLLRFTPSPSRTRPKFLTLERRRLGERRASNARKCQKGALFSSS
jgi:hypothetical protein